MKARCNFRDTKVINQFETLYFYNNEITPSYLYFKSFSKFHQNLILNNRFQSWSDSRCNSIWPKLNFFFNFKMFAFFNFFFYRFFYLSNVSLGFVWANVWTYRNTFFFLILLRNYIFNSENKFGNSTSQEIHLVIGQRSVNWQSTIIRALELQTSP